MSKHYFATDDQFEEEILGVFEDALQVSPFLNDHQRNEMINLLYHRTYEWKSLYGERGERINLPFPYTMPSDQTRENIRRVARIPDALELLEKAENSLRNLHELDAEEADGLADEIRSLLIKAG
jgi:hypothetical protein